MGFYHLRSFLEGFMGLKWFPWKGSEGMLVGVWEKTIADIIVGKCS